MVDLLEPGWGDNRQAGLVPNEGCDFMGAWPAAERRTTVKDLLKMKRQQQDLTGPGVRWSDAHSGQTPVNTASIHKYGHFCLWPEDPSLSPRPHPSPEHINSVSPAHPSIAPGAPIPAHMDLSPTHALTNPPTPYPNLPGHLHLSPPAHPSIAPGAPIPAHMDQSPTHALTNPPTPYPNLPGHLHLSHPNIASSPPAPNSSLPGNLYSALQVPHPSMPPQQQQQQMAGAAITTLFHWQLTQQFCRMRGVSPEMINMRDSDGDTLLHIAVAQGKRALAYVLAYKMAKSGTLDLPEHNGQTALHIAAATDQPLMVCDLLECGAHVHRRDAWGRSPLHVCVEKGHVRSLQSMLRMLKAMRTDFDVDMVNYDGLTPLHVAILAHNATVREASRLKSSSGGEREALLKKGQVSLECVKALLQMGASCGATDQKSGRTCLHMAAEEANTQLLSLLLNQPSSLAVVNLRTFSGNTALHIVCAQRSCRSQLEAVHMLLRRGADPGARNYENELPCQLLPEGGRTEKARQVLKGKHFHM